MISLSFFVPLRKANAEQLLFTSIITQNFAESRIRAAFFAPKMQDVNVHRGFRAKKVEKYVRLPNRFGATYPAVLRKICVFMENSRTIRCLRLSNGDMATWKRMRKFGAKCDRPRRKNSQNRHSMPFKTEKRTNTNIKREKSLDKRLPLCNNNFTVLLYGKIL